MKKILLQFAFWASLALLVSACQTSTASESTSSNQAASTDITACERNTKAFLASDYHGDKSVPVRYFTPSFAKLWLWALEAPPGELPFYNYDPILETQDAEPALVSFGPGVQKNAEIHVPVVYQHIGSPPYTKNFVFVNESKGWLVSDIITTGLEGGTRSEAAFLASNAKTN
jgi:hypothetical protein